MHQTINLEEFLNGDIHFRLKIINKLINKCRSAAKCKEIVDQVAIINEMIEKRCDNFVDKKKIVLNSLLKEIKGK